MSVFQCLVRLKYRLRSLWRRLVTDILMAMLRLDALFVVKPAIMKRFAMNRRAD